MALIIPTGFSTFADSTKTEGPIRKYILAQFRSDAELDWVGQLRTTMVVDEVKYGHFRNVRPRLRSNEHLWSKIEKGVSQATIIVIDPQPVQNSIRQYLKAKGAEEGLDFDRKELTNRCATAIIGGTPVAYLPTEMARLVPWESYQELTTLNQFTPETIRAKIGDGLNAASIFAARSYAMFDVYTGTFEIDSMSDAWRSPMAELILCEIMATERVFDNEHPQSVEVLNEIVSEISKRLSETWPMFPKDSKSPLIREADSRAIDHIQAADIAAGWARDILETSEPKALGAQFERVWVNGRRLK